ncbi:MAG: hypothetical protein QM762_12665 [Chryseolinea sp.]
MISSLALYEALDRDHKKYYNWTRRRILMNSSLEAGDDYIIRSRRPLDILMTADLTKAILVREGTTIAKKLRRYINTEIPAIIVQNPRAADKARITHTPQSQHSLYVLLGRNNLG